MSREEMAAGRQKKTQAQQDPPAPRKGKVAAAHNKGARPGRKKTFVSACIPAHNGEKYVRETIRSLLLQDYGNYEVVLIDNASTDSTEKIAKSFGDSRLRYVKYEKLAPPQENWGRSFEAAKGEYVCICHADDTYEKDYVSKCAAYLDAHPSSAAVFSAATMMSQKGRRMGKILRPASLPKVISHDELALFCAHQGYFPLICPSFCVRADAAEKCGKFDGKIKFAFDMEYYFRLFDCGKIGFLGDTLVNYRQHPAQGSVNLNDTTDTQAEFFLILERELAKGGIKLAPAERRKLNSYRRWGRTIDAVAYARFGRMQEAFRNSSESFSISDALIAFPSPRFIFRGAFSLAFLASLYLRLGKPFADAVFYYKRMKRG
jgi:glycosyltransferase involved in cell wall biosynthesis